MIFNIIVFLLLSRIHLFKIICFFLLFFLLFYKASLNITICEVSSLYKDSDYYYYHYYYYYYLLFKGLIIIIIIIILLLLL